MRTLRLVLAIAALVSAAAAQSADPGKAQLIPNAHKYSDNGFHSVSGRSGSAVLQARALRGKNGYTKLELTSGSASKLPAGNIAKVQYKLLNRGVAVQTLNWKPVSASSQFTQDLTGLQHNQQMQIQANITGIDRNRTDVVTITASAKDRPYLKISDLGPTGGMVNTPISISATVHEVNGDLGAHADCVLYVDGVEADRVHDIWVDAGGTVGCQTTHTFAAAGAHQLAMRLENISPTDWDSSSASGQNLAFAAASSAVSDKVATATITIVLPPPPPPPPPVIVPVPTVTLMSYSAAASDATYSPQTHSAQMFDDNGNLIYDYSSTQGNTGWQQSAQMSFWRGAPAAFPLVAATFVEKDDGAVVAGSSLPNIVPDTTSYSADYNYSGCLDNSSRSVACDANAASEYTQSRVMRVVSGFIYHFSTSMDHNRASGAVTGKLSGDVTRTSGDVTYLSQGFLCPSPFGDLSGICSGDPSPPDYYVWNGPDDGTTNTFGGARVPFGSSHQLEMSLQFQQGGSFYASGTMQLQPYNTMLNDGFTSATGKRGSVSFSFVQ